MAVMVKRGLLSTWSGRVFVASLVFLITLGVLGVGVLFSNTSGATQVAANAQKLHWTNATLGTAGITRAAIAQAVFFSYEDVSNPEGRAEAIDEARGSLAAVSEMLASPDAPGDRNLTTTVEAFVTAGHEAVDLADSGDATAAELVRLSDVEPSFQDLNAALAQRQSELAALIVDSDRANGRISAITSAAIAFVIPAVAMIIFWSVLRRRLRDREAEMAVDLEAERELNRAKDEFIAGLSHELRTPLTTIFGFSEILSEDPSIAGQAREMLNLINAGSADLSRMVNDLLTAARLDADAVTIKPQIVDLAEQVKLATSPYIRAGDEIDIRVPRLEVYADPLHVRQIVHNLISNALRHGGDRVVVTGGEENEQAVLAVADDGPGVPPEMQERLFKRFVHQGRQPLVVGSVGLGLAISNELAKLMGASLHYQRVDKWTTFALRIPSLPKRTINLTDPQMAGSEMRE